MASTDSLTNLNGHLSLKETYKLLDDPKKKIFNKYHKWKNSFYNESNLLMADEGTIVMNNDQEYRYCCVKGTATI